MNYSAYAAVPAVNFSTLKTMEKSPLAYRYRLANPREDSTSLIKGRATHTAVFEPDQFPLEYAVFKGKIRRGAAWEAFKEQHHEDSILKPDEYRNCIGIRDAVRRHPAAAELLARGKPEHFITWTDPGTGLVCKSRLDFVSDREFVVDLKGCPDIDERRFGSVAARQMWFAQLAFYRDGYAYATGKVLGATFIAVEINEPHDVAVFELNEDDLAAGTEKYQGWLARVKECQESGTWPGKYPEPTALKLPKWIWPEDEQDMTLEVLTEGEF